MSVSSMYLHLCLLPHLAIVSIKKQKKNGKTFPLSAEKSFSYKLVQLIGYQVFYRIQLICSRVGIKYKWNDSFTRASFFAFCCCCLMVWRWINYMCLMLTLTTFIEHLTDEAIQKEKSLDFFFEYYNYKSDNKSSFAPLPLWSYFYQKTQTRNYLLCAHTHTALA